MFEKTERCNKIHEIYPQIGECDKDLKVMWGNEKNGWEVKFTKDGRRITLLAGEDAAPCMAGKPCIGFGIEFGQFR